ncbi:helix-turn-helix transcriptional regulator [Mesobacillus harenae]|uniref:helix-turn-helix transcriptional regulator n=1 Tax=Mesobacillus harenae TaxID=2213203 RepID=UPI0015802F7C|nr:helix-turn-helix transcriptional regulator [Mesobacillus harenae]
MAEITYTAEEIAKMFKISKHTVYELIKRGELSAFKVGNKMRVEQEELDRFKGNMGARPQRTKPNLDQQFIRSLHLAGSHDFLVEHLIKYVAQESAGIHMQPSYIGSLEGLMMLYRGSADIAAIHLLDPSSQEYNLPFIKQLFVHEQITVMRLASRKQGLIVAKGNPKNITDFSDLTRKDVKFVNRQKGAGTRFLLDSFLAKEKVSPSDIVGYETEEWNHLSAGSYISRGSADVTFGIHCAASQLGLEFIPIAEEQFDLVFRWTAQNKQALEHLLDIIHFTSFKNSLHDLAGYNGSEFGKIIYQHP